MIPVSATWPDRYQVVDSLVTISALKYPKFHSPTLFKGSSLPESLDTIAPIVNTAHPGISNLTCAVLHPSETSCLKTFAAYIGEQWGQVGKFITAVYVLIGLASYKSIQRQYFLYPSPLMIVPHPRSRR
jgi:hypothetical protein